MTCDDVMSVDGLLN